MLALMNAFALSSRNRYCEAQCGTEELALLKTLLHLVLFCAIEPNHFSSAVQALLPSLIVECATSTLSCVRKQYVNLI